MDLDAEMAKLAQEARRKLDADRPEPAPLPTERPRSARVDVRAQTPSEVTGDAEVQREVQRLVDAPDEAGPRGPRLSMGAKLAIGVGGLIALNVAWIYIIKPLVGIAILLGAVALIVLGVMKLLETRDDDDDGDDEKKNAAGGA